MNRKLLQIFDYQRFSRNKDLQKLINETNERYDLGSEFALAEGSLALVSGGKRIEEEKQKDKDEQL